MKRRRDTSDSRRPKKRARKSDSGDLPCPREGLLDHVESFGKLCNGLRDIVTLMKERLENEEDIGELRQEGVATVSALTSVQRKAASVVSQVQQGGEKHSQRCDKAMYELQALRYEQLYINQSSYAMKNIAEPDDVSLPTEEEFYSSAPEELQAMAKDGNETLAKLHWEIEERASLDKRVKKMQENVATVQKQIDALEQQRKDVQMHVKTLCQAASTFQKNSGLTLSEDLKAESEDRAAIHLPGPLYVLYKRAKVHAGQLTGITVEVSNVQDPLKPFPDGDSVLHMSRASATEMVPACDLEAVRAEPQSVLVSTDTDGSRRCIVFHYIPRLDAVAVNHNAVKNGNDLLSSQEGNDNGLKPLRLSAFYLEKRGGVSLDHLLRCGAVGRLYRWAQNFAGLECLQVDKVELADQKPPSWPDVMSTLQTCV